VDLKIDRFTYRVTWSEEDQEHVGLCTEFPSLSWLASSPEQALMGIRTVVAEVIRDMEASAERVPKPIAMRRYSGRLLVRIPPERYELIIYWSDVDQAYIVEVPELPGCMADGGTYQEAVSNAETIIREWIETAQQLGRAIPEPRGRLVYA
jgi:predicted RNase H-like HicB family nuclease